MWGRAYKPDSPFLSLGIPYMRIAMEAQERAVGGERVGPVDERRRQGTETPHEVGVAEEPVLERDPAASRLGRPRPQHEPREIHLPAVRRGVRAVVVAELALIAKIHHPLEGPGRKLLGVAVHLLGIEAHEQILERGTERDAAAAAVADIVDPAELLLHLGKLPERLRAHVECHCAVGGNPAPHSVGGAGKPI